MIYAHILEDILGYFVLLQHTTGPYRNSNWLLVFSPKTNKKKFTGTKFSSKLG
jgi:hypothetical protein